MHVAPARGCNLKQQTCLLYTFDPSWKSKY